MLIAVLLAIACAVIVGFDGGNSGVPSRALALWVALSLLTGPFGVALYLLWKARWRRQSTIA